MNINDNQGILQLKCSFWKIILVTWGDSSGSKVLAFTNMEVCIKTLRVYIKKKGVWWWFQCWAGRDKRISRCLWPTSLAGLLSSKPKRDSISKNKVSKTEVPKVPQGSPLHAYISTHMSMCTHIVMYTHKHTLKKKINIVIKLDFIYHHFQWALCTHWCLIYIENTLKRKEKKWHCCCYKSCSWLCNVVRCRFFIIV